MNATVAKAPASAVALPAWRRALINKSSWFPVVAGMALLIIMFSAAQMYLGNFLSGGVISSLFVDNAYLIILAAGMTLVIITGGIDLSVGAVMAYADVLAAFMLRDNIPVALVVPAVILVGMIFGLLTGVLVHFFNVQPFIASLAGMFLARGLCYIFAQRQIPVDKTESILSLNNTKFRLGEWYTTPTVIMALVVVLILAATLAYTRFGRTVYAIGGGEQSAKLMGLPVGRTKVLVYVISGACSGIAGVAFISYTAAGYAQYGVGAELDTIAAVVIGGTILTGGSGYVFGSLLGVLVYGVIKTFISFNGAEQSWTRITIGILLLAFVVVQRLIVARANRR